MRRCSYGSISGSPKNLVEDGAGPVFLNLKKHLKKSSKAYGYKPLEAERKTIELISMGKNVIFSSRGTYMLGKMAMYCLAILNRVDLSIPVKCQCLIIAWDADSVDEIIENMQSLGGSTVKVAEFDSKLQSSDAHVLVADFGDMHEFPSFSFSCPDIKMLVFDWGYTPVFLQHLSFCTEWIFDEMSPGKILQFVLFSETLVPDYMKRWLQSRKLNPESRGYLGNMSYNLERVKKHRFVNVEVGLENYEKVVEVKVNAVVGLVDEIRKPGTPGRIIIFVSTKREFKYLTRKLGERHKISKLRKGMSLRKRNLMIDKFIGDDSSLLITVRAWHHDMSWDYFCAPVSVVIYCDCHAETYTRCLGWFQDVGCAITVVDNTELHALLEYQKSLGLWFEKFGGAENDWGGMENGLLKFGEQIHHPVVFGKTEDDKRGKLDWLGSILVAAGKDSTTSVFLVKDAEKVKTLVSDLKDTLKEVPQKGLVITGSISEVAMRMNEKDGQCSCVFVTSDIATNMDEIKDYVRVMVIYDMRMEKEDYRGLFDWCSKDGVVIHLVTYSECFELMDVQVSLGFTLESYNRSLPIEHLEQKYPSVYGKENYEEDVEQPL